MTPMDDARSRLARHLVGRGIEIGPGVQPFPSGLGTSVLFIDRWVPDESRSMFPELGSEFSFQSPDVVCNLDVDGLGPIRSSSQDFVIASHVLEHLADPLRALDEIARILKPGGLTVILLPDRERTFDRERAATTLEHLITDYESRVTVVDDDHMTDFLLRAGEGAAYTGIPEGDDHVVSAFFDWHRQRSIHVHCWAEREFLDVLLYAVETLGHPWELVDVLRCDDEGPDGFEFGYVLRRAKDSQSPAARRASLTSTWRAFYGLQPISDRTRRRFSGARLRRRFGSRSRR